MRAARDKKPGFDFDFNGTVLKIKLRGEIDHHSAVSVRSSIDGLIRSRQPRELIIDMSAVDFMDSSGLGLIMGRYAIMKELGGTVSVADPNKSIEKIMGLAGMERIIPITHTQCADKIKPCRTGESRTTGVAAASETVSCASGRPQKAVGAHRKEARCSTQTKQQKSGREEF